LSWQDKFLQWLPILIFALRHATRGAMSLRARGLRVDSVRKTFYYNYQSTSMQKRRAWLCLILLIVLSFLSEWFNRT
jgi:energy-coupling factor transporter transmembrane protein EcfT